MAICKYCGKEMLSNNGGCKPTIILNGVRYNRIPFGTPNDMFPDIKYDRCVDCGVEINQYHHLYCDAERCPKCGEQLLSCDCELDYNDESIMCTIIE